MSDRIPSAADAPDRGYYNGTSLINSLDDSDWDDYGPICGGGSEKEEKQFEPETSSTKVFNVLTTAFLIKIQLDDRKLTEDESVTLHALLEPFWDKPNDSRKDSEARTKERADRFWRLNKELRAYGLIIDTNDKEALAKNTLTIKRFDVKTFNYPPHESDITQTYKLTPQLPKRSR